MEDLSSSKQKGESGKRRRLQDDMAIEDAE
jgi:hypothetical protein